jgi:F-type H+-transporting ATPase subunit epsilon
MAKFRFDLVSPQARLFSDEVEQVDLPGAEGDFGVLAGHAPIVALLRPRHRHGEQRRRGRAIRPARRLRRVFRRDPDGAGRRRRRYRPVDAIDLKAKIDDLQDRLGRLSAGDELDRAIRLLDDYKSLHVALSPATAF